MVETRNAVLVGNYPVEHGELVVPQLTTDWKFSSWVDGDGPEKFAELVATADALVSGAFGKVLPPAPRLRLFQIPFAGYEWLDRDLLPADCVVANTYEHEIPIAEYVLRAMLEWQIGANEVAADFRAGSWHYHGPPDGPSHDEVFAKSVGLLGYGHIAKEIARRAAAFGMRCIAVTRMARPTPAPLDWLGTSSADLDRLLAESDFLVVACPLSAATEGMIDAVALARMKPNAVLINVARGPIVVERDLYQALRDKVIRAATLDVWYRYPDDRRETMRPSEYPFHELDNVEMTPHCSGWTSAQVERRFAFVAANMDRFARGEQLRNVINFE